MAGGEICQKKPKKVKIRGQSSRLLIGPRLFCEKSDQSRPQVGFFSLFFHFFRVAPGSEIWLSDLSKYWSRGTRFGGDLRSGGQVEIWRHLSKFGGSGRDLASFGGDLRSGGLAPYSEESGS